MNKKLYKGTFNNSGELIELYTHAYRESEAWHNFIVQIAGRLAITNFAARMRFLQNKNNNTIKEVTEKVSSRKKNIKATLSVDLTTNIAFLPPGTYEVAVQDCFVEEGAVKLKVMVIKSHIGEEAKKDG